MHKKNNPDWPTSLSGFFVSYLLVYIPEKTNLLVCPYPVHSSTSKFFDTVDEFDIFQLLTGKSPIRLSGYGNNETVFCYHIFWARVVPVDQRFTTVLFSIVYLYYNFKLVIWDNPNECLPLPTFFLNPLASFMMASQPTGISTVMVSVEQYTETLP